MILESFEYAEADIEAREVIEARNEAEAVLRATEKAWREPNLRTVRPKSRTEITAAADHLRETVISGEDHQAIREAIERLIKATHHFAEIIMNAAISEKLKDKRVREIE